MRAQASPRMWCDCPRCIPVDPVRTRLDALIDDYHRDHVAEKGAAR